MTSSGRAGKILLKTSKETILDMWPLVFHDLELESSIFDILGSLEVTDTFFSQKNWKFFRNVKKRENMLKSGISMTSYPLQMGPKY